MDKSTFGRVILSILVFIGVNIICFREHGIHMLVLFMPSGTSLALAFVLVPIEIISYVFQKEAN